MITREDYFMGRDKDSPPTEQMRKWADETIYRANLLLSRYYQANPEAEKTRVTSGYRTLAINSATPNSAPRSKHLTCQAVDLSDPDGELDDWCMDNQKQLEQVGLWMEHPSATKGWCHLQIVPPRSGKTVFFP